MPLSPATTRNLSLVVLAYNEEGSIEQYLQESLAWLDTVPGDHEILVIDDGSRDATAERASRVASHDSRVRVISHEHNRGMGAGLRSGFTHARGDYVAMLAGDGQIPASALDHLLPHLDHADIVLSVYSRRPSERYRVVLSRGLRALMRITLGLSFRLEGTYLFPVRIAREDIGLDCIAAETFFFSFELISRALGRGYRAHTVTIEPRQRQAGSSKVANLRSIGRVTGELLKFRMRLFAEGKLRP